MIVAILKIIPLHEKRKELLDIFVSIKGPVLSEPGCMACCIYNEFEEEQNLLYVEQWQSMPDFERHVRGDNYNKILEAMELSSQSPEVFFYETGNIWGLELIEEIRRFDK